MSLGSPLGLRRRTIETVSGPLVSDSFDRPDSATSLGTADTGQVWSALAGTGGIDTNRAYFPGTTPQDRQVAVESGASDVTVAVDLTVVGVGSGLLFRAVDASNYWIFIAERTSTDRWVLYKRVAGTHTVVGESVEIPTTGRLSVAVSGTSITCKVDGVTKITATDTAHQAATRHGLRDYLSSGEPASRFDNFLVEAL